MISSLLNENIDTDIASPIVTKRDNVHISLHPKTRNKLKKGSIHGDDGNNSHNKKRVHTGILNIATFYWKAISKWIGYVSFGI